jgi:hypothetical protein
MKYLIAVAALMFSVQCFATDWVRATDNDEMTTYSSPAGAVRFGNSVSILVLMDYKTVQVNNNVSFQSIRSVVEINCVAPYSSRVTRIFAYSDRMGEGTLLVDFIPETPDEFHPIVANSSGDVVSRLVCNQ